MFPTTAGRKQMPMTPTSTHVFLETGSAPHRKEVSTASPAILQ